MTQEEFANFLGVKTGAVGSYERGDRNPKNKYLKLVCEKFGCSLEWLLTGDGPMKSRGSSTSNEATASYAVDELHALRLENATLKGRMVALQMEILQSISAVATSLNLDDDVRAELMDAVLFPAKTAGGATPPLPAKHAANGE